MITFETQIVPFLVQYEQENVTKSTTRGQTKQNLLLLYVLWLYNHYLKTETCWEHS